METNKNGMPTNNGTSPSRLDTDYSKILAGWTALEKRLDQVEKSSWFRMHKTLAEMQNQQLYHSASSLGAGILGLGLGVLLSKWLSVWPPLLIAFGLFIHSWGMYKLHFSDTCYRSKLPNWLKVFLGIYGLALVGLLGWLLAIFL
jgi:hypothetical protein